MHLVVAFAALALAACEQPYVGLEPNQEEQPNTVFRVTSFEQLEFDNASSRAATDIASVCSRLNLVVYNGETKVKSVAQKSDDKDFGTLALTLAEGTYQVAIIAHSTGASATVTSLEKISFSSNVISDTFLYYGEITVGEGVQTHDVQLRRVVAMFRLNLTQPLPANVSQLKFYYTGGSSTLSAVTGYGSVNSKQTVTLPVATGQSVYEVYTFPHAESGQLKMTITALDASKTELFERVFEEVPVTRNKITQYRGDFFGGASSSTAETHFTLTADTEWNDEVTHEF